MSRNSHNNGNGNGKARTPQVRCAIYTRKSTEEGLEQEFNTLDAQRETGEAYVASQKSEGWVCLPDRYDDGGFTGANIERPAVKRLLADIEAGKVDCVVVYKVVRRRGPVGQEHWHSAVRNSPVRLTHESTFSFDIRGGAAHITQRLQTIATHLNPSPCLNAPDFRGAGGATADGVDGTNVVVAVHQFAERHRLPATFVTPACRGTVFGRSGPGEQRGDQ